MRRRRVLLGLLFAMVALAAAAWAFVVAPLLPAAALLRGLGAPLPARADLEQAGAWWGPDPAAPRFLGVPARGEARAPVVVVVPGVTREGLDDPRLWRLMLALRSAGAAAVAPALPGLVRLADPADDLARVADLLEFARGAEVGRRLPGSDPGRVGLLGVSLGAPLALRAAARSPRGVRAVLLVGSPDDPRRLAAAWFREPEAADDAPPDALRRAEAARFARRGLLRGVAAERLPTAEAAEATAWLDRGDDGPLARVPLPPAPASAEGLRWMRAAAAEAQVAADDLAWVLDAASPLLEAYAPAAWESDLDGLRAPCWIAHGVDDPLVPVAEARPLAARLARRVSVETLESAVLAHVDLGGPALGEAWRHARFLAGFLRALREDAP